MVPSRSVGKNLAYQAKIRQVTARVNTPRVSTQRDRSRLGQGSNVAGAARSQCEVPMRLRKPGAPPVTIHACASSVGARLLHWPGLAMRQDTSPARPRVPPCSLSYLFAPACFSFVFLLRDVRGHPPPTILTCVTRLQAVLQASHVEALGVSMQSSNEALFVGIVH